jgi:hypothetical protein
MEKIELKNSQGKVIGTVDRAEWESYTQEHRDAFMATFEPQPEQATAPTERLRAAIGQGAMLGFGDEAMAALRAPFGEGTLSENYDTALTDERARLAAYREAYPASSLGYEMLGAAAPVLLSGGAAAPVAGGRMAAALAGGVRGAIGGAKAGMAYGFGSGEGGVVNRAANAGVQGLFGAGLGGMLGAVGGAASRSLDGLINWVRNKSGDRMAGAVSNAVQQLAERGGLTPDEVIDGVRNGTLMAENKTLDTMIRRFYAEGGPAGAEIKTTLSARPGETRAAAMEQGQAALGSPGNPLANRRVSEQATEEAEDIVYEQAFRPGGVEAMAPDNLVAAMADIAGRAPNALKAAADVARVKYGITPFFTEAADGTIQFGRAPTLREAELTYRSLRDMADKAYADKAGTLGGALKDLGEGFKGRLDVASPPLAAARAEAKVVRDARDAFKAGTEAFRKSPDELALLMDDITALGPDAVAAFREGMLTSLRAGMSKPSAAPGMMRSLSDETTGPGTALRLALPPGTADDVTRALDVAASAQKAKSTIIDNSVTSQTMLAPSIDAAPLNMAEEAVNAGSDLMAWARMLMRIAGSAQPKLTDAQRLEVARIVLSKDPALVERALKDSSMVGQLQQATIEAIDRVTAGATRAAPSATSGIPRITISK